MPVRVSSLVKVVSVATMLSFSSAGWADEPAPKPARAPLKPAPVPSGRSPVESRARSRELVFSRYDHVLTVVRPRTPGKNFASFTAEPQPLEPGSKMVFEIRSETPEGSTTRWRCVAQRDVAECLGAPVRVRYEPGDRQVVLTAAVRPAVEPVLVDSTPAPTGLARR